MIEAHALTQSFGGRTAVDGLGFRVMPGRVTGLRQVTRVLWEHDVIPDFRAPEGLPIGLSPLSTSVVETDPGVAASRDVRRGIPLGQAGLAPVGGL